MNTTRICRRGGYPWFLAAALAAGLAPARAPAGDVEVHLDSNDGASAFVVLDSSASNRLNVLSSGRVGIGIAAPTHRLEVQSTGQSDGLKVTGSDGAQLFRVRENSDHSCQIQVSDSNGVVRVMAHGSGRIGINTPSPEASIVITDPAAAIQLIAATNTAPVLSLKGGPGSGLQARQWGQIKFLDPSGNTDGEIAYLGAHLTATPGLRFMTEGSERLKITDGGRVGIGTSEPEDVLTVKSAGYTYGMRVMASDDSLLFRVRQSSDGSCGVYICDATGQTAIVMSGGTGRTTTRSLEITGGSDLSEYFEIEGAADRAIEPGSVVCIDAENPGRLIISRAPYDRRVAGIVSGAGGIHTGMLMGQTGSIAGGAHPIALSGRVYCRCDASAAAIETGDLLTTSDIAGHAMKVTDSEAARGAVLGKAMTPLHKGARGLVLVLVSLQ